MTPEQRDALRDLVTDYGYSREHGHPCEHERLDGVLAFVDALTGTTRWSSELPAVVWRFYWCRSRDTLEQHVALLRREGDHLVAYLTDGSYMHERFFTDYHWAGPLPEPLEGKP